MRRTGIDGVLPPLKQAQQGFAAAVLPRDAQQARGFVDHKQVLILEDYRVWLRRLLPGEFLDIQSLEHKRQYESAFRAAGRIEAAFQPKRGTIRRPVPEFPEKAGLQAVGIGVLEQLWQGAVAGPARRKATGAFRQGGYAPALSPGVEEFIVIEYPFLQILGELTPAAFHPFQFRGRFRARISGLFGLVYQEIELGYFPLAGFETSLRVEQVANGRHEAGQEIAQAGPAVSSGYGDAAGKGIESVNLS